MEDITTVVSCMPFPVHKTIPHVNPGFHHIPEVKDVWKECEIYHVGPAVCHWYSGNEQGPNGDGWIQRTMLSQEIAEAIVRDEIVSCINVVMGFAQPAITFFIGQVSKQEVVLKYHEKLDAIRELQKNWFKELVNQADIDFAKIGSPGVVSDLQRKAAKALNLRREWDIDMQIANAMQCPACNAVVSPSAVVCTHCRYILDEKLWSKMKDRFAPVG